MTDTQVDAGGTVILGEEPPSRQLTRAEKRLMDELLPRLGAEQQTSGQLNVQAMHAGGGLELTAMAAIRVEALIDALYGSGTPERVEFEIGFQHKLQKVLRAIIGNAARSKLTEGLNIPGV